MEELTPHQSKALDFDHSISLRANAGSGKTFVLAKRYLQIIIEGRVPVQKIAAITFTDKAAGEMEERLDTLMPIGYETIQISTFHSFCEKLLRQFGIDIGISSEQGARAQVVVGG